MSKFTIYESPMCCSTGVCGPDPDPKMIELQDTLKKLTDQGLEVERFIITQSPEKFKENADVLKLINENDLKALPITVFDGKVTLSGCYPTYDQFIAISKGEKIEMCRKDKSTPCCGDDHCCC